MNLKNIALATLVTLGACSISDISVALVSPGTGIAPANSAVLSADKAFIFHAEAQGDLVLVDAASGGELERFSLSSNIEIVELASMHTDADHAWSLHANGLTVKWNTDLDPIGVQLGRPMGTASSREYCDLDVDAAGNIYVASLDVIGGNDQGVLAKRDVSTGAWTTVNIDSYHQCPTIAYDDIDNVVVATGNGRIKTFSPSMTQQTNVELNLYSGPNNIDVLGGYVVASGDPDNDIFGDRLYLLRVDGVVLDGYHVSRLAPVESVQLTLPANGGLFDEPGVLQAGGATNWITGAGLVDWSAID